MGDTAKYFSRGGSFFSPLLHPTWKLLHSPLGVIAIVLELLLNWSRINANKNEKKNLETPPDLPKINYDQLPLPPPPAYGGYTRPFSYFLYRSIPFLWT